MCTTKIRRSWVPPIWFGILFLHELRVVGGEGQPPTGEGMVCADEVKKYVDQRSTARVVVSRQYKDAAWAMNNDEFKKMLQGKKCAVVGNSGGLLKEPFYGEQIDQHDVVLRLNQAPTEGYVENVGSKTTIRLTNKKWSSRYGLSMSKETVDLKGNWGEMLVREPGLTIMVTRSSDEVFERILSVHKEDHAEKQCKAVKLENDIRNLAGGFVRAFKECMRTKANKAYPKGAVATSGFLAITALVGLCDSVTTYGVGIPWSEDTKYQYYHWVGPTGRETEQDDGNPTHGFEAEQDLLHALAANGVITMCLNTGCLSNTSPPTPSAVPAAAGEAAPGAGAGAAPKTGAALMSTRFQGVMHQMIALGNLQPDQPPETQPALVAPQPAPLGAQQPS
eukprot:CAMPEP_0118949632 /NCGR_PEP_ID=MMETSP1169-20130426/50004_1 /TAXON_ID=36882 /ORGANISM="Pyramimonas obovata, Strain CCMP722" /LENGTH=391 /DNA_ID=CAMNT_0006896317 /DNA_START=224 /DNA_END=1395 /DNA_ORIENTATION=+